MTEPDESVPEAEVPEYLADAGEPEEEGPSVPRTRVLRFARMTGSSIAGRDAAPRAVPEGGQPLVGFDLTTHEGHFTGAGHNRLLLFVHKSMLHQLALGVSASAAPA